MKLLLARLLLLTCTFAASSAQAQVGLSVEVYGGGALVQTVPPAVVYTPPVVYYEQPQVKVYEYQSYWGESCYENPCKKKRGRGHHKHKHRKHHHDD